MKPQTVHLGFEVGTGEPVEIPLAHLCVTGQTQLSGKTTTLAAIVLRSGVTAIAFATKRGEGAFGLAQLEFEKKEVFTQPYFKHRAGWQFVSDILGAVLSEKLKFERSWIMKVSRGAKTLKDVHQNVKTWLKKPNIRSLDESVLTTIDEYFELFMPELTRLPYAEELVLVDGALNVMDLSDYSTPLQMLVIASVLDEVYQNRNGVAVVIPEAWEFVPNSKNSPVKSAARTLVRKGGALKNFIWLDSQDLASIDTEIRRACSTWILGVQREQNEVKRMLSHITDAPKPKVDDIMKLEKGQFYACFGKELHKTYVQPAWMDETDARLVATGVEDIDHVKPVKGKRPDHGIARHDAPLVKELFGENAKQLERLSDKHQKDLKSAMSEDFPTKGKPLTDLFPHGMTIGMRGGEAVFVDPASKYGTPPPNTEYFVDDGTQSEELGHNKLMQQIVDGQEQSMDQQEREQYLRQIDALSRGLYFAQREIPSDNDAKHLSYEDWLTKFTDPDHSQSFTKEEETRSPRNVPAQGPGSHGKQIFDALSVMNSIMKSPPTLEALAKALTPYLPTNGVVKVEPREVVLKEFQQAEVERILSGFTQATPWQKSAVRYLHAKGSNSNYAALVRAVKGKEPGQHSGEQNKRMKEELKLLVQVGVLRSDSAGRYFPELEKMVKDRLAPFNASDKEAEEVIGQVLLKLK